jgi:hypothetical protein
MFSVEYYCPFQGPEWHGSSGPPHATLGAAIATANMLKTPNGNARVLDSTGRVVYFV